MILLSAPNISGNEWKYVKECLDTEWVSSVGSFVNDFEKSVSDFTKSKYAVACSSGTSALHISLIVSGIKKGDYVIVPNITFIASANSIKYLNANPIFIDVNQDDWQMDLDLLSDFLEKNTYKKNNLSYYKKNHKVIRAIMAVHILGNICDMDKLSYISSKYNIKIIEDASESLGSYYNGKHSGTFGEIGVFSFNGNKIITSGGGGMIVTNNLKLSSRAKHITTQAKAHNFEYFHDEVGFNYRLVNPLAAIGLAQMENLNKFIKIKQKIDSIYRKNLNKIGDIKFQKISKNVNHNSWLFTFMTKKKDLLLKKLNSLKIQSRPLWIPMNRLPIYEKDLYVNNNDISNKIYQKCISIPSSSNLKDDQIQFILKSIKNEYL